MTSKKDITGSLKEVAEAQGITKVVVASRGGKSAIKVAEALGKGVNVISISEFSYNADTKKRMKKLKMTAVENADLVLQDIPEMKEALISYGPKVKAALEVAAIASKGGLIDGKILAASGGRKGIDTALVLEKDKLDIEQADLASVKEMIDSSLLP